ncbi:hypothetical protein I7I51_02163 [Histoplasma capsulatum]|uniref:Uncharacterized protein n=1 Tax=Ajellomyces capsulatus TaxID=5037 RepID=A0A8A1M7D8_AJECA|nr:hypothetical protein I7I51_02163 [Histoplasma capsulatum]
MYVHILYGISTFHHHRSVTKSIICGETARHDKKNTNDRLLVPTIDISGASPANCGMVSSSSGFTTTSIIQQGKERGVDGMLAFRITITELTTRPWRRQPAPTASAEADGRRELRHICDPTAARGRSPACAAADHGMASSARATVYRLAECLARGI